MPPSRYRDRLKGNRMLDQGTSYRNILTVAAWLTSLVLSIAGWCADSGSLRCLGVISAAIGCLLVVLNDNMKTRRVVRAALRDDDRRVGDLTVLH